MVVIGCHYDSEPSAQSANMTPAALALSWE
jgi:hypothetical protein